MNKSELMKVNILDCTLRDGGYYNNWQFSPKIIQSYIDNISNIGIRYVEIGFLFLPNDKKRGLTANCDNNFFKSFKFPKHINFGIMINASDLINFRSLKEEKIKIKTLENLKSKNISFIRIACHFKEVFKIEKYLKILKKNRRIKLFINIMQITEIDNNDIRKICLFSKKFFTCLYIADSLGSLREVKINQLIKSFRKYWDYDMGIHAHDNLSLALKNTIFANKIGLNWLDCTITGMGRGPGNTKTEHLVKKFTILNHQKKRSIKKLLSIFLKLKKKYKWVTNYLYKLSGKHKIHPTYIQTMLSDKRYNKKDYLKAIEYLKNNAAKNFNPFALLSAFNVYKFNKKTLNQSQTNNFEFKKFDKALILGPGETIKKIRNELSKNIKKTNILVLCLNNSRPIKNDLIHIRTFCHPMRIFSNLNYFKQSKNLLLVPYSCLSKNTKSFFDKKNLIDYGIEIKKRLEIKKDYVTMNTPLSLIYSISFLISRNITKIYLAGFDGFSKDEPNHDSAFEILKSFKKIHLMTLTQTKHNLKKVNPSELI